MNNKDIELKQRVFSHYGGGESVCVRCGFSDVKALSIDHIDGNDRSEKRLHGGALYQWLVDSDFPDGFQTLCMNCQWIKRVEEKECSTGRRSTLEQQSEAFRRKFGKGRERRSTRVTKKKILDWCQRRSGEFSMNELVSEFGLKTKEMASIYVYLHRLVSSGELERLELGHYKLPKKTIKSVKVFNR